MPGPKEPDLSRPEADQNQEENLPQQEAPESEAQLSPEVIEKIMAKVIDIDRSGVAYTRIASLGSDKFAQEEFYQRIRKGFKTNQEIKDFYENEDEFVRNAKQKRTAEGLAIFQKVLLHGVQSGVKEGEPYESKEWRNFLKGSKKKHVYFNIVGRSIDTWRGEKMSPMEIGKSYWARHEGSVTLVFDISGLQELPPNHLLKIARNYRSDSPELGGVWSKLESKHPGLRLGDDVLKNYAPYGKSQDKFDENGYPVQDPEHGFVLSGRIAPRRFRGAVLKGDQDHFKEWVPELADLMIKTCENKIQNIVPIYDTNGNLLWPKRMSYEEVKRYVAERDAKKAEEGK